MRIRRAQNISVLEAGQHEVVGVPATHGQQARIFGARHPLLRPADLYSLAL
jgi:hypothetical protein